MYGKIFESIYEGTLYGHWKAIVTMQQLIVLSDADGVVDMTPQAIAGKTSIPLDIIEEGLEILSQPDPHSRTPGDDGVRIRLLDDHRPWGWYLVNHQKYRDMQDAITLREKNRERKRKQRERDGHGQNVTKRDGHEMSRSKRDGHAMSRMSRHTDTDTDTDTVKKQGQRPSAFDQWWTHYPKKRKKKNARDIWKRKKLDPRVEELTLDVLCRLEKDERWQAGYIPDPTTYLNQERWEDELTDGRGKKLTYAERMKIAADKLQ